MVALITCGDTRPSLASVRALGRADIPVAVGSIKRPSLATWSRYAKSSFLTKDPSIDAKGFAEQVAQELKCRYATCALVSTDSALWALSRFRDLLPIEARKILPPHYSVVRSLDHEALHHFAESLGILCARLIRVEKNLDVHSILSLIKNLKFPVLIRPIVPWIEREDGSRRINNKKVVKSKDMLLKLIKSHSDLRNGFLISAYQTKRAVSYFGVCEKGQVLAGGFQERLYELEPYNEVATVAKTIHPIPSIKLAAQSLLDALQWRGPFKVEFVKDESGCYRLVSLIGRLWGSMQLAIKANVNVPLICYQLAKGTLIDDVLQNAKPSVKMRWLMGDTVAKFNNPLKLFTDVKDSMLQSSMKRGLFSLLHSREKAITYHDVFDFDDPMPFLFEVQKKTWCKAFGK